MNSSQRHTSLSASNFRIRYGEFVALDLPSLALNGNVIALIGHNGAGKSTFIKSVLDLLPCDSGTLSLQHSEDGAKYPLIPEKHMAFCPETGAVFADISVESYIKLWCRMKHHDPLYYRKEGAQFLEMLDISPLLSRLGRELSKGQRRRVQTAIGFLTGPKLFLFDEPFDGLDIQKSQELSDILAAQSAHMSMIISSHRMDVVERLADSLIVLKEGRIAAAGSVTEVCHTICPQNFQLTNLHDIDQTLDLLRAKFPQAVVQRLGERISLSGSGIDAAGLLTLVRSSDRNGAELLPAAPSLIEAMHFHLKS